MLACEFVTIKMDWEMEWVRKRKREMKRKKRAHTHTICEWILRNWVILPYWFMQTPENILAKMWHSTKRICLSFNSLDFFPIYWKSDFVPVERKTEHLVDFHAVYLKWAYKIHSVVKIAKNNQSACWEFWSAFLI